MLDHILSRFDESIAECDDAITVHEYLANTSGFKADFNLRFVWIASISALDHFVTQAVLEIATNKYASGEFLSSKLRNELTSFEKATAFRGMNAIEATIHFRETLSTAIRYKSFHRADHITDGLAYIWTEKQKWQKISQEMGLEAKAAKEQLDAIVDRRNVIAHNADINDSSGNRYAVQIEDARKVASFTRQLAYAIRTLIT